jgi:hypothetical protein
MPVEPAVRRETAHSRADDLWLGRTFRQACQRLFRLTSLYPSDAAVVQNRLQLRGMYEVAQQVQVFPQLGQARQLLRRGSATT